MHRSRLESRASELALEGDSLGRGLKAAVAGREKALVEHDVLKLQVRGRAVWGGFWCCSPGLL